jgi:hypothetical protein
VEEKGKRVRPYHRVPEKLQIPSPARRGRENAMGKGRQEGEIVGERIDRRAEGKRRGFLQSATDRLTQRDQLAENLYAVNRFGNENAASPWLPRPFSFSAPLTQLQNHPTLYS